MLQQPEQGRSPASRGPQHTLPEGWSQRTASRLIFWPCCLDETSGATLLEPPACPPFCLVHTLKVGGWGETPALQTWVWTEKLQSVQPDFLKELCSISRKLFANAEVLVRSLLTRSQSLWDFDLCFPRCNGLQLSFIHIKTASQYNCYFGSTQDQALTASLLSGFPAH